MGGVAQDDDRLDALRQISDERWTTHHESHAQLARALEEYKASANEWRATLSDIRTAGISRAEYSAEHKLLRTELEALIRTLDLRLGVVERSVQSSGDRDKATRDLFGSIRSIVVVGFIILGGLISLVLYLERAMG